MMRCQKGLCWVAGMNVPLRQARTQDEFCAWAGCEEGRYEFDGVEPVDMNGTTINHAIIISSLLAASFHACVERSAGRLAGTPAWQRSATPFATRT